MNFEQRAREPELVCTCNDLYRRDIQDSIDGGCEDVEEIMYDQMTQFRCEMCRPIMARMLEKSRHDGEQSPST